MKKYFLNDGTTQQGPFDLAELRTQNITPDTPVWYEGLPEWTTAGKLEELKDMFAAPAAAETVATATVEPVPVAATSTPSPAPKPVKKKGAAWISWALSLLVLGGVGFLVYQDMQKNKTASSSVQAATTDTAVKTDAVTTTTTTATSTSPENNTADTSTTVPASTDPASTDPVTTSTTPTTATTATTATTTKPGDQTAAQKAAAKKAEEDKKKKQAAADAAKKAEAEKKKQEAAQAAAAAAAAKEKDARNNWSKYITFGQLNYTTKNDAIQAFDVPINNNTDAVLDKVTIRLDYVKKDKKVVKTETIDIYRIPPHASLSGKAPESRKGDKVNAYITAVTSRGLHFCYPQNNGNKADPYFCN